MNKLQFVFLSAIILLAGHSCKNNDTSQKDEVVNQWIKTKIENAINDNNIPAFSIAINRDRKPPFFESFGTLKRDSAIQVNETSIYPIGLLSKTLTGIIVNSLIDEGKLNYDEPISTYLSDILTEEAIESFNNVPLKNLLHHRSGITDKDCSFYKNRNDEESMLTGYSSDQFVNDLNQIRIDSDDQYYRYSNFGFAIVGYVCEKISGKSYAALLKEYVTDKYDLPNTVIQLDDQQKHLLIPVDQEGIESTSLKPLKMGLNGYSDRIYSNIVDLSKLQKSHFKSYQNYFERGMASPLILTERTLRTRINNWKYGIGFMQITNDNGKFLGYYREENNYASVYLFSAYPNVGITVLTTKGGPWLRELSLDILDGLVDERRIRYPRKRSIAWTMFSIIDADGLASGIEWFNRNKDSKNYSLDESEINSIGYRLLREENIKEAIAIFNLNVLQFPESSNVYDSIGEAYADDDNDELAILNYQKSLDLDPDNSRAKRALKRLRSQD